MQTLTLSYSKLSEYGQCPQKFKYHYVLKYPTKSSAALFLGQVVHDSIKNMYGLVGDIEIKHDIFRKKWAEHRAKARSQNEFELTEAEEAQFGKAGLHMITTFDNSTYTEVPAYSEELFRTQLVFGKIDFLGKIDRLGFVDNSTEMIVTDYKTGKFSPKFLDTFQIYAYVWLANELGIKVRSGQMFFLNENQIITKTLADIEFGTVKDVLIEKSMDIYNALQNDDFQAVKSPLCGWCDFKQFCPAHSEKTDQPVLYESHSGQLSFS